MKEYKREMAAHTVVSIDGSEELASAHGYDDSKRRKSKQKYREIEWTTTNSPRAVSRTETRCRRCAA